MFITRDICYLELLLIVGKLKRLEELKRLERLRRKPVKAVRANREGILQ
jgi:hypothetical protein